MGDGGGDERPRGGGEPASPVEIMARLAQGEQVVDVEYKPEKQVHRGSSFSLSSLLEQFSDRPRKVQGRGGQMLKLLTFRVMSLLFISQIN